MTAFRIARLPWSRLTDEKERGGCINRGKADVNKNREEMLMRSIRRSGPDMLRKADQLVETFYLQLAFDRGSEQYGILLKV